VPYIEEGHTIRLLKKTNNDHLLMLTADHHMRTWRQQNESTIIVIKLKSLLRTFYGRNHDLVNRYIGKYIFSLPVLFFYFMRNKPWLLGRSVTLLINISYKNLNHRHIITLIVECLIMLTHCICFCEK
jgi:hypothetical protein